MTPPDQPRCDGRRRRRARYHATAFLLVAVAATAVAWSTPAPAAASPAGVLCTLTGLVSGVMGKVCNVATRAGKVVGAGKKLLSGNLGGAVSELTGSGGASRATSAVGITAVAAAVVLGARYLLQETATVVGASTRPNLTSTWFSSSYWRMAGVAALLTLPFLFAAAVQAMLRSDLALLARAAFGYLPMSLLAVGIAAPVTMLLLAGSDEMSTLVSSASGHAGLRFLSRAEGLAGVVGLLRQSAFVPFFIALLTAAATIALWVELVIRDAAVYVIVLMLPLFFAAMVWPARRVWAARAVELLVALILSKFAIVAVLALGGAALGHATLPGPAEFLTGTTLVMLAAFSPWALMRLLPLQEVAGTAMSGLRGGRISEAIQRADLGAASDRSEEVPPGLHQPPDPDDAAADAVGAAAGLPGDTATTASGEAATAEASAAPEGGATAEAPAVDGGAGQAEMPGERVDGDAPGAAATSPGSGPDPTRDATGDSEAAAPLPDVFRAANGQWRTMPLAWPEAEEELRSDRPLLDPEPGPPGSDGAAAGPGSADPESPGMEPQLPAPESPAGEPQPPAAGASHLDTEPPGPDEQ